MVPLSVWGPASSGGGWVVGFCCCGGGGVAWAWARGSGSRRIETARRTRRAGWWGCMVIV
jgi:hypothetical protein